jgi:hypothetical protein
MRLAGCGLGAVSGGHVTRGSARMQAVCARDWGELFRAIGGIILTTI